MNFFKDVSPIDCGHPGALRASESSFLIVLRLEQKTEMTPGPDAECGESGDRCAVQLQQIEKIVIFVMGSRFLESVFVRTAILIGLGYDSRLPHEQQNKTESKVPDA